MHELGQSVTLAAAARNFPGESVSGDCWRLDCHAGRHRLSLVDGAGHGKAAAHAASVTADLLALHPQWSGTEALEQCHRALRATRGAVLSIAEFEPDFQSLILSGIGNVECYLWDEGRERHLVTQRGMLGAAFPKTIRPFETQLSQAWTLVLHSDGVRARFSLRDPALQAVAEQGAEELASTLLRDYARADDDATVVVVQRRA
ncbi:MAG: SpoIIE family protein phosphatase [Tepidiformaceae bacterium]